MEYKNFTSLPPEQEQAFVVYERKAYESSRLAVRMGGIAAAVVGIFAMGVFLSFDAVENAHAVHEETDIKEEKKAPPKKVAPKPTPAAEIPAEPAAAPAAAGEAEATAAPVTAPTPPKGATKAPPTALIGQ